MMKLVYHQVYNQNDFFPVFAGLVQQAQHRVIIVSPFIFRRRVERCIDYFRSAISRGVVICVITQDPQAERDAEKRAIKEEAISLLRDRGIHVSYRQGIHEKLAVFDELFLCDGSLNVLSQSESSERMNVFESPEMVADAIAFHQLDACDECKVMRVAGDRIATLRETFVNRREALGLTKRELAARAQVQRMTLSRFEAGKDTIRLNALEKLCWTLGLQIRCVPNHMIASVDRRSAGVDPLRQVRPSQFSSNLSGLGTVVNRRRRLLLLALRDSGSSVTRTALANFETQGKFIAIGKLDQICESLNMTLLLVPTNLCAELDSEISKAFEILGDHRQKIFEGINTMMHSLKTARLSRMCEKSRKC